MAPRFERAIRALSDAQLEFVIIGGFSAILHGSAHVTLDLNIVYSRNQENLKRLAAALAPLHPRPDGLPASLPFVWDETTLANGTLFTLTSDLGRIDLMAEVSGLGSFSEIWAGSVEVELYGCKVRNLSLTDLLRSKRAAGRLKDLQVIPELESILEALERGHTE